jgi:hypothetical protein
MKPAALNSDEMLKTMVAEAVKQTQIRSAVRDITLKALQARELGLAQISSVVRNVTAGVNAGLADKGNVERALADAVAGMDDALLKVVEANQVALTKLPRAAPASRTPVSRKRWMSLKTSRTDFATE